MAARNRSRPTGVSSEEAGAALACWYCELRLRLEHVRRDGILRARDDAHGGPYRLYACPGCNRQNHCEKTPRGRWFSSPSFQPNLFDYILGAFTAQPCDFLKAATWYRENEARRRYFFERDGDSRYHAGGWWRRLWPRPAAPEPAAARRGRLRAEEKHRRAGERRDTGRVARPRIVGPWEILGVPRDASENAVRRAFHRLAILYHPDKVHHLGEEFQRLAHRKFTELKEAYDELMRRLERPR
jgi:hypothetical protein